MNTQERTRVLVIDDFHPVFADTLHAAGIQTLYRPGFSPETDQELLAAHEIIAVRSKINFSADLISNLPVLRCIARGGAGMDNIDENAAAQRGITLLNAPEGNRDAVAEHCIGMLLCLSNQIHKSQKELQQFVWDREGNRGWEIGSRTIGLVGFGNTGSTIARKLSGFGAELIAYDKYIRFDSPYARQCSLEELLERADVISFHIPLTDESRGMINSDLIGRMKDGVVLINAARGGICRTADVWEGIKSGKVKGFASDVLENENMASLKPDEKQMLSDMMAGNQVIITPHVAGWSFESYRRIAEVLAAKIIEYTTKVKNI